LLRELGERRLSDGIRGKQKKWGFNFHQQKGGEKRKQGKPVKVLMGVCTEVSGEKIDGNDAGLGA